jgi:hypothetical protein
MLRKNTMRWPFAVGFSGALGAMLLLSGPSMAQEEVASSVRRYAKQEASTGYYEEYEAKPRRQAPLVGVPSVSKGIFPYSPSAAEVRVRTRLSDSHRGIKFYQRRRCEDCHVKETRDMHTVRAGITCRQCHGGEPVASLEHYYSPMNPIRRHAYVCSKCHEGAGASFASYVVHSPNPALAETRKAFPVLFYAFWIMVIVAGGTLVVFLPHSVIWGVRELVKKNDRP